MTNQLEAKSRTAQSILEFNCAQLVWLDERKEKRCLFETMVLGLESGRVWGRLCLIASHSCWPEP